MRHPGAVEAVAGLARLVRADLLRPASRDRVAAGHDGGHAADGVAPRLWQVRTSSSVYARMNGAVMVTCDAVRQQNHAAGPSS